MADDAPSAIAIAVDASASNLKRKSLDRMTPPASSNALVRTLETSVLRSLAFVLYHLDRTQARYCVRSILQWYDQLQKRLPVFAVDSLETCATSLIALSDAEFTAFWVSLVDEPSTRASDGAHQCTTVEDEKTQEDRDATLVKRLYRQICGRIQRLFGLPACVQPHDDLLHTQTPLTSPDDKYDERAFYRRRASLRIATVSKSENAVTTEPGWAVEYMEQESQVSSEITQRMRRMMHSSIPLNLFRAAVVYPRSSDGVSDDDVLEAAGFVGVVSPESFPPTPITRDLQTRRIHHYTATVLDHATLALRLLDTNYAG